MEAEIEGEQRHRRYSMLAELDKHSNQCQWSRIGKQHGAADLCRMNRDVRRDDEERRCFLVWTVEEEERAQYLSVFWCSYFETS